MQASRLQPRVRLHSAEFEICTMMFLGDGSSIRVPGAVDRDPEALISINLSNIRHSHYGPTFEVLPSHSHSLTSSPAVPTGISGVPRYTVKTGSSASKLGRSSRAKADSTCSHSVLSALMLLLLPSFEAEEPVFTVYLGTPLSQGGRRLPPRGCR